MELGVTRGIYPNNGGAGSEERGVCTKSEERLIGNPYLAKSSAKPTTPSLLGWIKHANSHE